MIELLKHTYLNRLDISTLYKGVCDTYLPHGNVTD